MALQELQKDDGPSKGHFLNTAERGAWPLGRATSATGTTR